jgi:hypothetical protein
LKQRRERWKRLLSQVEAWARELAAKLGGHGVRVDEIKLFGSVARGDYTAWSDLDLVVLSRNWEGIEYSERLSLLYKLWDKPMDANFIPLTPSELAERLKVSVTLRHASRYWVTVYRKSRVDE